jgi:hypothetical protein
MAKKRIGILNGGGDVPRPNAVIKSVTYRGSENDIEAIGLRRGWEALTHLNVEDPASRSPPGHQQFYTIRRARLPARPQLSNGPAASANRACLCARSNARRTIRGTTTPSALRTSAGTSRSRPSVGLDADTAKVLEGLAR